MDRDQLFGVFAIQLKKITPQQLASAADQWIKEDKNAVKW